MSTRVPREKAVFVEALEIADPEQRGQFLDQACGADQALRQQVEKLLALSQSAGDFFQDCAPALEPVAGDAAQVLAAAESAVEDEIPETKCIGPYKLLQKLGEGGYGAVYMAEQEQPIRRRVALKIIKLGMDTKNVIARFEAERQALALMDHPNIARVLDAGATETGRPYLVMELVYGVKITEYCDQNCVSMPERLQLFIQVCNAVQHAHQKGIIHRDLKPSNIMVTMHDGVPVPKVIDFGIAKATEQRLTDKTLFTSYAELMGTPAYMSPEQMEFSGLNLDTRSDIYSLGVLLYELLTGRTPFDTKELLKSGVEELRRTVREREPLSPSAKLQTLNNEELTKTARRRQIEPPRLLSQLHGDLDWIVLKCLEKDRTRRYATANALAMDIEHYLQEEPVLARPPSQLYRLQKLVRRNRMVFLLGAAAATALLLGSIISTWLFIKERAALRTAVAARRDAEAARATEAQLRHEADWRETVKQAGLLMAQSEYAKADKLLDQVPFEKPSLKTETLLRMLGDWSAINARWPRATERFASLIKLRAPDDAGVSLDHLRLGVALIEANKHDDYDRFRRDLVSRFGSASNSLPDRLVKCCLLLPANGQILQSLQPAAEAAEKALAPGPASGTPSTALSLALLAYRQGNDPKAVTLSTPCLNNTGSNAPENAVAHAILALADWRLQQYGEGFAELSRAQERVDLAFKKGLNLNPNDDPGQNWFDWVLARLLVREGQEQLSHADRLLALAAPPSEASSAEYRALGDWHATRQEWDEAAARLESLVQADHVDSWDIVTLDYLRFGPALIEADRTNDYERFRRATIAQYGHITNNMASRIIKCCVLLPASQEMLQLLEPQVHGCQEVILNGSVYAVTWSSLALALLEYRQGHADLATNLCHKCLAYPESNAPRTTTAHLILALSYWHLHQYKAAMLEMAEAEPQIDTVFRNGLSSNPNKDPQQNWFDWVIARILLRECDEKILETGRFLAQTTSSPAVRPTVADDRVVGEWLAVRQEWREAANWYSALLKANQGEDPGLAALDHVSCGALLAEIGDRKAWDSFRQETIERFQGTRDELAAERIIEASLIEPVDDKILDALVPLAEVASRPWTGAEVVADSIAFREAWRDVSLGLFEYRSGHDGKAVRWCRSCLACREDVPARTAIARVILAMSLRQNGEPEAAISELEQAHNIIQNAFGGELKQGSPERGFWFDWLVARVLLREASELLPHKPNSTSRRPLTRRTVSLNDPAEVNCESSEIMLAKAVPLCRIGGTWTDRDVDK